MTEAKIIRKCVNCGHDGPAQYSTAFLCGTYPVHIHLVCCAKCHRPFDEMTVAEMMKAWKDAADAT